MPVLKIKTIPEDNLRKRSRRIRPDEIPGLKQLFSDMIETVKTADGIGLAAPQIGQNIRLAVIAQEATADGKDLILINPEVKTKSWRKIKEEEGCLSVPGVVKKISRAGKIAVRALDKNGRKISFSAADLFARVIQHEIDHLDGILIVDKNDL